MIAPEQLDNWFTYHAPTDDTKPKYAAVRDAEQHAHEVIASLRGRRLAVTDCDVVNESLRHFVSVIDANAPDSADKSAAIRCVRLARNGANEFIMANVANFPVHVDVLALATTELVRARWQANSAIACDGK